MADNDFSFLESLKAEETALPKITRAGDSNGRERAVQNNPFVGWLTESKEKEIGKQVAVPARQWKQTVYLIRQAAEDLGIGVRIVNMVDGVQEKDRKALLALNGNKRVTVLFQAQKKKKYSPRTRKAGAVTVTQTAPALVSPSDPVTVIVDKPVTAPVADKKPESKKE